MVLAPRKLARAILLCRVVAVGLEAAALTYTMTAADLPFTILNYLKTVLFVHLPISVLRLMYDVAQVFNNDPLPADRWLMATLVATEWAMLTILFSAGMSSAAVVHALYRELGKCRYLPPGFCDRYKAAVILTNLAWFVTAPIALLMVYIGAFWLAATVAAEAAAAAQAAHAEE